MEQVVSSGGGSCARCRGSLGLASLKASGTWYCSSACADGRLQAAPRTARVPEPWLYARPRRHFRARRPKELRDGAAHQSASSIAK